MSLGIPLSKYTVVISPAAKRDLSKLPAFARRSIEVLLADLELTDHPKEKLGRLRGKGDGLYSLRTGEFRVIISIIEDRFVLLAVEVGPRKTIYRKYRS